MKKEEPKKKVDSITKPTELNIKEVKGESSTTEIKGNRVAYATVDIDPKPEPKIPVYKSPLPSTAHPMAEHYVKEFILAERDILELKDFVNELPNERRAAKHPTLLKYFNLYRQYADK